MKLWLETRNKIRYIDDDDDDDTCRLRPQTGKFPCLFPLGYSYNHRCGFLSNNTVSILNP